MVTAALCFRRDYHAFYLKSTDCRPHDKDDKFQLD